MTSTPLPTPGSSWSVTLGGVRATYAAFITTGFVFASWAARIPQVKDRLDLGAGQLGLLLLAIAVGSLVALPLAGAIVTRFGSRRTVAVLAVLDGAAVAVVAVGYHLGATAVVAAGLVCFGFAQGGWDVAMNVQAAVVERRLGRAVMSRFHAGFSLGTVAGALLGALLVAVGVGPTLHLIVVGAVIAGYVPLAVRGFVPDVEPTADAADAPSPVPVLAAWTEPRTLLIGVFVLTFAFAEGTGNDWAGVALIEGYGASDVAGPLGFAMFLAAMTVGRWFGPQLLERYGRVGLLQVGAVTAGAGVVLFALGPNLPTAFVGTLLWGAGTALGFPVGMSAAADEPVRAPARVSVVASLGYCAFLAGPPLIGAIAAAWSVLTALLAVAVGMGLALVLAPSTREPQVLAPQPGAAPEQLGPPARTGRREPTEQTDPA